MIEVLGQSSRFGEWHLETLFSDRNRFLSFLQERWPRFLSRVQNGTRQKSSNVFTVPGPNRHPFRKSRCASVYRHVVFGGTPSPR